VIPNDCKRLIEADFPIAEVSRHAAREKSIRHGHPSTLHLWWARRPLASSRAVLMGLLLPDPCDPLCPSEFKDSARKLLRHVGGFSPDMTDRELREALLKFIGDFANWDLASNRTYLDVSRDLVKAAYGGEPPLVVDSFAGGGSIPLEALRLGADAFANDLNPVPVLLCRFLLEDVPRFGQELAQAMEHAVQDLTAYLRTQLAGLYAADSADEEPTAYLWSRTVNCEEPNCGAAIPLLRSMWLSKSKRSKWSLSISVRRREAGPPDVEVKVFSPKDASDVSKGTVVGGRAVCPACSKSLARTRIEAQLRSQHGGTASARLVAVMVAIDKGRVFRSPTSNDRAAIQRAGEIDGRLLNAKYDDGTTVYPDETINPIRPSPNARGLSAVTRYGMETFADCHLPRQRVALSHLVAVARKYDASQPDLEGAIGRFLLILLGRCVDRWSSCSRLDSTRDTVTGSFSKQALQLVWDFCEANPFSEWSGGLANAADWITRAAATARITLTHPGDVNLGDACALPLPDQSAQIWFTDPPYYDSVPYADLADFFFCWLRRANPHDATFKDGFDESNVLTPKAQECVWNQSYMSNGMPKDPAFFERTAAAAFGEGRRILQSGGVGCVVFAHKSTEGWEALLGGMIRAGLSIVASWPIQTEMKARTAARDAASLMGSVHLIFRARSTDAPVGDWGAVLQELPGRVGERMERLQAEGVHGADLLFACIGPALEIFSRYARVETADGRVVVLAEYLEKVWEVVGRSALAQVLGTAEARARNGAAGAVEEDARLTALFLWTLQTTNGQIEDSGGHEAEEDAEPAEVADDEEGAIPEKTKGFTLVFDVVRRFAQPLGIELPQWEGRVIETKKGVVRLLPITERATQLFGEDGGHAVAARLELEGSMGSKALQGMLFPEMDRHPTIRAIGQARSNRVGAKPSDESLRTEHQATTLDRVHAGMLLQSGGRTNALRALLKAEQERGPDFLRLANALSALYPKGSEEKRLLDAMLLVAPR
jgi:putative DNA methylase